jgi:hypothetical protein
MAVRFYFDEHMRRAVVTALARYNCEAIMAVDVDMIAKDDDTEHLLYATKHHLVMVTFDRPFAGRTMSRNDHSGLICIAQDFRDDIGTIIRVLVEFSEQYDPDDTAGQVFWLP